jgi:hypothetical protein
LNSRSNRNDVIRFVAEMRADAPTDAPEIDPEAAETLVKTALDPDLDADIDPEMAAVIQGQTIIHVLGGPDVTRDELDALLAEATEAANRHLAA